MDIPFQAPDRISRRGALVAGGAAMALALTTTDSGTAEAATPTSLTFNPRDHGAVGDGKADDTAAFQAAITAAAAVRGRVQIPVGSYVISSLTLPTLVRMDGQGADFSVYGSGPHGGVELLHLPSATAPLLVVNGNGVSLDSLALHGNGSAAPLIRVVNGFESRFNRLQLASVAGTALLVDRANNNSWSDIFVDRCGSATQAAVVVKSPMSGTGQTNTFTCVGLTIEIFPATALDIAYGATADYYAEFVRFDNLHIEQDPEGNSPQVAGATGIVRIGNVRHLEMVSCFVYGGPSPAIVHEQMLSLPQPLSGGIRLIGGTVLGTDPAKASPSTDLVRLVTGDDFAVIGTRFARYDGAGIVAEATYGAQVALDPTARASERPIDSLFSDRRASRGGASWLWPGAVRIAHNVEVGGHVLGDRADPPTAQLLPANGTGGQPAVVSGSDVGGWLVFGRGAGATSGAQVRVVFSRPFDVAPAVVVTPSGPRGQLAHYVTTTTTGFTLFVTDPVPSSLTSGRFGYHYVVVG